MKVSDYIVSFFIEKGITDVFGYPGGMVTHIMDSFLKYKDKINAHINYHEQASAFAACGYAQASGNVGIAYATSGPGATNLITGIAHAYFDNAPTLFITGQVNTYESKEDLPLRQKGFQETDIVSIVKPITKYAIKISSENDICYELEKAYHIALSGRFGPVLLDIPMDVQRKEINPEELRHYTSETEELVDENIVSILQNEVNNAKRPCLLLGNGIKCEALVPEFRLLVEKLKIPVVSSMPAFDVLDNGNKKYYGFIGAYGDRCANFIIAKSDLIISVGSRLDSRQVSTNLTNFAPNAKLVRFDIDENEFENKIKPDEIQFLVSQKNVLKILNQIKWQNDLNDWIESCNVIKDKLSNLDDNKIKNLIINISNQIPDNVVITTDVGQNQVWIAQHYQNKQNQIVLFSSSHGAMGYSLPAAIGAYYATKRPVIAFMGDGGFQMNCQELEFIKRENIPIKIIVFNNYSLGMIRHFQEMYFNNNFAQTVLDKGYSSPNFSKLADAYDIDYYYMDDNNLIKDKFNNIKPTLIEIGLKENTYVFPKLAMNKPPQDQEPLIDRELYDFLMKI